MFNRPWKSLAPEAVIAAAVKLEKLGAVSEALYLFDAALAEKPLDPLLQFHRALCLLSKRQWAQGWEAYEYRRVSEPGLLQGTFNTHLTRDDFRNREVIIYGEQGVGDEIMFASCVPDVMRLTDNVTLTCDARLVSLFTRSFPGAAVFARNDPTAPKAFSPDPLHVMAGSLPRIFRRHDSDFGKAGMRYLLADAGERENWQHRRTRSFVFTTGLSWRGGTSDTRAGLRSIYHAQMLEALRSPKVVQGFFSLQHDQQPGEYIVRYPETFKDFDALAAFVCALDCVVTVQSSVAHLCGALGVPCIVLVSAAPEWRYGVLGTTIPWYPSVTLARQDRLGDWREPLYRASLYIADHIEQKHKGLGLASEKSAG